MSSPTVHVEVSLRARNPGGSPTDHGSTEFTYRKGSMTTIDAVVGANGDIDLEEWKKQGEVLLVFELKTRQLTWGSTVYTAAFIPNDVNTNNGRSLMRVARDDGSGTAKPMEWSYNDLEFDHFQPMKNGEHLTVRMKNKRAPDGKLAHYTYCLSVCLSQSGNRIWVDGDPQIKNGGNWQLFRPQIIFNVVLALVLTALVLTLAFR